MESGGSPRPRFDRETLPEADYELFYSYNNAGALTKLRTTHPQSGAAADTQCFSMDHLQRLRKAWTPASGDCTVAAAANALGGPSPYFREWAFDKASNRTSQIVRSTAGDTTSTWAYPAAGQPKPHQATSVTVAAPGKTPVVSPVEYDAAGNVTERTVTAGAVTGATAGAETLSWNPEGRLSTASRGNATTAFVDDPSGNRLLRRDATTTTLYLGATEITLTRSTGAFKTNCYISFGGQTIAVRTGPQNADVYTLWSDLNNTSTWQMSRDTNKIETRRTLPYGEPRAGNTTFAGSHGFVDGLEDKSLGLVRVGAREYDPASGMFLSPDPVINISAPVQWSPYTYGGGNPVIHPDPSGLSYMPMPDLVTSVGPQRPDLVTSVGSSNKSSRSNSWRPRQSYRPSTGKSWSGGSRNSGPSRQSRSYGPRPSGDASYVAPPRAKPPADQSGPWWEQLGNAIAGGSDTNGPAVAVGHEASGGSESAGPAAKEVAFGAIPVGGFGHIGKDVGKQFIGGGGDLFGGNPWTAGAFFCRDILRSFGEDTLVLLADGTQKPIGELKVGERIQATDPDTGETTSQTVEQVWVHDDALYRLHVDNGEVVKVTEDHPIYSKDASAWRETKDLPVDSELLTLRGSDVRVARLDLEPYAFDKAYNLTVTGPHTFHVGEAATLVHNCGGSRLLGLGGRTNPPKLDPSSRVAPWAGPSLSRLSRPGEVMYRVYGGGAGQAGSWLTPIKPVSSAAARQGLALPAENGAFYVSKVTLPGGVRMQVGTAGPAFGQPGGWPQAQLLDRIPLSSFGKGVQLQ